MFHSFFTARGLKGINYFRFFDASVLVIGPVAVILFFFVPEEKKERDRPLHRTIPFRPINKEADS